MLRFILVTLLIAFIARAFWRIVDGMIQGVTGTPRATRTRTPGVEMVRDPVCGTFVVPDRAVTLEEGRRQIYFCSDQCRDQYRARIT